MAKFLTVAKALAGISFTSFAAYLTVVGVFVLLGALFGGMIETDGLYFTLGYVGIFFILGGGSWVFGYLLINSVLNDYVESVRTHR